QEVGSHFIGVGQCRGSQPCLCMGFRQQQERPHAIQLSANLLPVPSRGMGGIEQVAMIPLAGGKLRQGPRSIVGGGAEEAVPALWLGVFWGLHGATLLGRHCGGWRGGHEAYQGFSWSQPTTMLRCSLNVSSVSSRRSRKQIVGRFT